MNTRAEGLFCRYHESVPLPKSSLFASYVFAICKQHINFHDATEVFDSLLKRVSDITPDSMLAMSDEEFLSVGISTRKAAIIRNIARVAPTELISLKPNQIAGVGSSIISLAEVMFQTDDSAWPLNDQQLRRTLQTLGFGRTPHEAEEQFLKDPNWTERRMQMAFILWNWQLPKPEQ